MKLERYMLRVEKDGNVYFRYNPPADAAESNIVQRTQLHCTYEEALAYCKEQNALLDEWRSEQRYIKNLSETSTVYHLYRSYIDSLEYKKLTKKTKYDYDCCIKVWLDAWTAGTKLSSTRLRDLSAPMCQRIYNEHAEKSVSAANHSLAVYKVLFNYAIRNGFTTTNPFKGVKALMTRPRRVIWEREHLKAFMDTAFSKYEWRNVGLIAYMAYSWGQRLGDMRNLKWSQYNIETGVLDLEQSKRRARVEIPTHQDLRDMLEQQHKDFGWQEYIAPSHIKRNGLPIPFTISRLAQMAKEVMQAAGLPEHIQLMDMRRTAVTEMVKAGVPLPNIMSVTGHATPHSLTPYMRNTLKSASVAQEMRGL